MFRVVKQVRYQLPLLFSMILIISILLMFSWGETHLMRFLTRWGGSIELTAVSSGNNISDLGTIREVESIRPLPADEKFSLPRLFSVTLKAAEYSAEDVGKIADRIRSLGNYKEVFYPIGWVHYHSQVMQTMHAIVRFLYVILVISAMLMALSSFALSWERYKDDVSLRLIHGATRKNIYMPFVVDGFFIGVISSTLAIFIFWSLIYLFAFKSGFTLYLLDVAVPISFVPYSAVVKTILCCGVLGGVSAFFATNRLIARTS